MLHKLIVRADIFKIWLNKPVILVVDFIFSAPLGFVSYPFQCYETLSALIIDYVLCFLMKSVDYDKEGSVLRVRGKNITENDHVKVSNVFT
jgi:hypothetical protein